MDVGMGLFFSNLHEDMSDEDMFVAETELGVMAEEWGYDSVWLAEHHFDIYAESPDNVQVLAYIAAKTNRIKVGTGAVILPWNEPVRVVEKMIVLDHLSGGRALFGMGRGLAQLEYDGFGVDMNVSRQMFDEAAEVIVNGLRTGVVENENGVHWPQSRVTVRPAPNKNRPWDNRTYGVAMSPDSVPAVAKVGATMMTFVQHDLHKHAASLNEWRRLFEEFHGRQAPPAVTLDTTYCHEDAEEAERMSRKHIGKHFESVVRHYDFAGEHWRSTKGYEAYQEGADMMNEAGLAAAAKAYTDVQMWGTPDQILEQFRERLEVLGEHMPNIQPCFGGMPLDKARDSAKLFAEKVIPGIKKMGAHIGTKVDATV